MTGCLSGFEAGDVPLFAGEGLIADDDLGAAVDAAAVLDARNPTVVVIVEFGRGGDTAAVAECGLQNLFIQ